MIDAKMKNYYSALVFAERPELHMTLRYWKDLTPGKLAEKIIQVRDILLNCHEVGMPVQQFTARFPREDIFGHAKKVHVMKGHHKQVWPEWLCPLVAPSTVKTFHVTCLDTMPLTLTATAVAIMHKKEEVCRWDLQKPSHIQPEPVQKDLFSEPF